jgi:hypothetical protein
MVETATADDLRLLPSLHEYANKYVAGYRHSMDLYLNSFQILWKTSVTASCTAREL